jgi:hypothetical protein
LTRLSWYRLRLLASLLASAATLLAGLATSPVTAHAAATTTGAVSAPLTVDCAASTPAAIHHAQAQGLCTGGSSVSPYNTVYGDCGSSWLNIYSRNSGGWAIFSEGAHSSLGAISYVNYWVSYYNSSINTSGGFGGGAWPWSSTWSHTDYIYTGVGYVSGVMSGYVVLVWGLVCYFNYPSDYELIG